MVRFLNNMAATVVVIGFGFSSAQAVPLTLNFNVTFGEGTPIPGQSSTNGYARPGDGVQAVAMSGLMASGYTYTISRPTYKLDWPSDTVIVISADDFRSALASKSTKAQPAIPRSAPTGISPRVQK